MLWSLALDCGLSTCRCSKAEGPHGGRDWPFAGRCGAPLQWGMAGRKVECPVSFEVEENSWMVFRTRENFEQLFLLLLVQVHLRQLVLVDIAQVVRAKHAHALQRGQEVRSIVPTESKGTLRGVSNKMTKVKSLTLLKAAPSLALLPHVLLHYSPDRSSRGVAIEHALRQIGPHVLD